MKGKRIWIAALILVISRTIAGIASAAEEKKIEGNVGWVTLDKKTMTLVREGKHLADLDLVPETVVKIMEEQKAEGKGSSGKGGKKGSKKDKGEKKDTEAKAEAAKEDKEDAVKDGKKDVKADVTTICYTIRPASVNDILSGWKANVTYVEQGKKKVAKDLILTPVVFGGDDED